MNNKILPSHILRLYTWDLLKNNTDIELVNGLVPIVPLEDEPRLSQSGKPYLIYGFSESNNVKDYPIKSGHLSFRVVTYTLSDMAEYLNVLSRAFEHGDQSAYHVNLFSSAVNNGLFVGLKFTYIFVTYLESPTPAETEGGQLEGVINLEFNYLSHSTVKQYQPTGVWA